MTTKKAPKTKKRTKRRTGRTTAQLRREVFHNFVLEVLLANVLAELDPRGAGTVVQQVSTLDGCVLERDREVQRIAGWRLDGSSRPEGKIMWAPVSAGPSPAQRQSAAARFGGENYVGVCSGVRSVASSEKSSAGAALEPHSSLLPTGVL